MDELQQALELTTGTIDGEKQILKGIATFGELNVEAIMTSRLDMVMLEMSTPFRDVLESILENEYSRIPIYVNTFDSIRGILYIKDLIPHLNKSNSFKWQTLIRPPYFVPETKKIDDLLQEFQKNRIHIAIVVDEFGGTSGLVTLEDILEEVVGDIEDEYDHEDKLYRKIDEYTYLFEAKILLTDFFKAINENPDIFAGKTAEVDTLAGLILELKGDFPKVNEKIVYKNFTFEIISVDSRRIKKIKLYIEPIVEEDEKTTE